MTLFVSQILLLSFAFILFNYFFLNQIINAKKNFISIQLKFFTFKIIIFSAITYFFCFFSPLNRVKFILLGLAVFISYHFLEGIIIQNKINKEDN